MDESKRFLLIAGISYYPQNYLQDLRGTYDTVEEGEKVVQDYNENAAKTFDWGYDWWCVVDRETLEVVKADKDYDIRFNKV